MAPHQTLLSYLYKFFILNNVVAKINLSKTFNGGSMRERQFGMDKRDVTTEQSEAVLITIVIFDT